MNIETMSRDERSLLLFLETCLVDYTGRVNVARMNDADVLIQAEWMESGFIEFGRIKVRDHNSQGTNWVKFSEEAWTLAHQERRARYDRATRQYERTSE